MKSSKTFWILILILRGLLLFFFFYKRTNEGFTLRSGTPGAKVPVAVSSGTVGKVMAVRGP